MRSVAVAAFVLLLAAGASAQERRRHPAPSPPPAPFVPKTLSTGGITTLVPPPPPSPFAARPGTYAPRYTQLPPFRAGNGSGGSIYNDTLGFGPYIPAVVEPVAPPPPVPEQRLPAPAPEPPRGADPPRNPAPAPEPPQIAAAHGPDMFYVIPGCYAGNRPPNPARLPKGCDLTKMRTTPVR